MVYDSDLKVTARGLVVLFVVNLAGALLCCYRHQWFVAAGFALWCTNLRMWRRMNKQLQWQRDRNRVIEAAMVKAFTAGRD